MIKVLDFVSAMRTIASALPVVLGVMHSGQHHRVGRRASEKYVIIKFRLRLGNNTKYEVGNSSRALCFVG